MSSDASRGSEENTDGTRRIRVLEILEATTGGTGRHLGDLVAHLDRERFEPSVICSLRRDETFGDEVARMREQGVPVTVVPMIRDPRPFADTLALRRLESYLAARPVDVVHVHSAKAGFLGRLAARRTGVARVVYTPHGFPFQMNVAGWKRWIYFRLERRAGRWTSVIICVSREELRHAARVAPGGAPAAVYIPNGVEVPPAIDAGSARDRLRSELGLPADARLIGGVGRLTRQKGFSTLVRAMGELAQADDGVQAVLIGEGEERPRLAAAARAAGVGDRVRFLGARDDARELCGGLDVLAVPSLWEGLPYAVLDAMARGVPVVASRVGGLVDVVRDGETGLLVPSGDAGALSAAVCPLLGDSDRRRQLGEAGRNLVRGEFTRTQMIEKTQGVYHRALS